MDAVNVAAKNAGSNNQCHQCSDKCLLDEFASQLPFFYVASAQLMVDFKRDQSLAQGCKYVYLHQGIRHLPEFELHLLNNSASHIIAIERTHQPKFETFNC
jgi:hypothetical protein